MSEYISYFRKEIDLMNGYTPGEQPKQKNILKLNTNESPFPPAPSVLKALQTFNYENLRLYPDPEATNLCLELGVHFGLSYNNVITGNGSDDILNIVMRCFTDSTHPVAYFTPSYSLYPTLAKLQGTPCIEIPLTENFEIPQDALLKAASANLLIITRPNAPTGNSFPLDIMAEICSRFHGIVMIDEAYQDFANDNCGDFVSHFNNVIIVRTFSKSRCLAGLRFGYAVAHKNIIQGMMKMKDSYNVSMLSQKLALASLYDRQYFNDCIAKIKLAREMLLIGLMDLGFKVIASETNFLFVSPPDQNAESYFTALKQRGIFVRYFPGERTGKYVRISVGTTQDVARLYDVTKELYIGSLLQV